MHHHSPAFLALSIGPISKNGTTPKISAICYVALRFRSSP